MKEALKRIAAYPFSRAEELSVEQMREIAREALAQPEQEPCQSLCDEPCSKVQKRKPLTDKQILADETLRYCFGLNGGAGPVSKQGRKIVNAIEAFHNIKEIEK